MAFLNETMDIMVSIAGHGYCGIYYMPWISWYLLQAMDILVSIAGHGYHGPATTRDHCTATRSAPH